MRMRIIILKNKILILKIKNCFWITKIVIIGAINMVGVGIAIATAGVIVGAVGSTGLITNLIVVIESVAKDNVAII